MCHSRYKFRFHVLCTVHHVALITSYISYLVLTKPCVDYPVGESSVKASFTPQWCEEPIGAPRLLWWSWKSWRLSDRTWKEYRGYQTEPEKSTEVIRQNLKRVQRLSDRTWKIPDVIISEPDVIQIWSDRFWKLEMLSVLAREKYYYKQHNLNLQYRYTVYYLTEFEYYQYQAEYLKNTFVRKLCLKT
jgi:hypothetical protein